ncbi:indole-3-glycerol-phosphate synthase [Alkalilimnicola ehrlichii]|uniref:Indole-3-glycerol phosphate synthase n=1 Tax=Alkalilimnicola ehrlichii TaxID=351052 RepID=A0A3E0X442_9GAMM|nr:indole-3-glycerol phosphate synthase TrpC [Alkalilimnicola ehrlichii]RFA31228.1 indole-3-glycerol-phosphate synthase [Alkalilimnicola ehrlichii]RFA39494.1 indole-3-glycerol-phosphate synthase [Alkalilimnicola ehrlichii]
MTQETPDVLKKILRRKAEEVGERSLAIDYKTLQARVADLPPPRGFVAQLQRHIAAGRAGVIAEIKRASPSKGLIREHYDPAAIARTYEAAGASCLSVLTDRDFFQGSDEHLQVAREACSLPVLRKDFVIDPYQIYEARLLGADCVLLIVAALGDPLLRELYEIARSLQLDVLVEVHDAEEMARALALNPPMVGVNNRNLRTFDTDIKTTLALRGQVPAGVTLITESGIHTREEVELMTENGIHGFLIGESFMRSSDPGEKLRELFS